MKKQGKKGKNVNEVNNAINENETVNNPMTETKENRIKTFIKIGFDNPENDRTIFVRWDVYKLISEKWLRQKYYWKNLAETWHATKKEEFFQETGFLPSEVKPVLSEFFEIFKRFNNSYIEIFDGEPMPETN